MILQKEKRSSVLNIQRRSLKNSNNFFSDLLISFLLNFFLIFLFRWTAFLTDRHFWRRPELVQSYPQRKWEVTHSCCTAELSPQQREWTNIVKSQYTKQSAGQSSEAIWCLQKGKWGQWKNISSRDANYKFLLYCHPFCRGITSIYCNASCACCSIMFIKSSEVISYFWTRQ